MSAQGDALKSFFDTILKGESKTYNDHNWYVTGSSLRGYIEGRGQSPYPLLTKPLSQYTIGEVRAFQRRQRDATGQLWATGRYQIIPNTLTGIISTAGLTDRDLYNQTNQDKLGWALLSIRPAIKKYIEGAVPDTTENLQNAALEVAKTWSSVGVPFPVAGRHQAVLKDQSFYAGGGDRASVSSDAIMAKLKELRSKITGIGFFLTSRAKRNPALSIVAGLLILTALTGLIVYRKQIIAKFNK